MIRTGHLIKNIKIMKLFLILSIVLSIRNVFSLSCNEVFNRLITYRSHELASNELFLLNIAGYGFLDNITFNDSGKVDNELNEKVKFYLKNGEEKIYLSPILGFKGWHMDIFS